VIGGGNLEEVIVWYVVVSQESGMLLWEEERGCGCEIRNMSRMSVLSMSCQMESLIAYSSWRPWEQNSLSMVD
jgi:hypothetical protein